MPPTGITLPFFSAGGTSTMILIAEMGIALSVSNQIKEKEVASKVKL
jgi:cell division protein FtsW